MTDLEMLSICRERPEAFTLIFPVMRLGNSEIVRLEVKNPFFDETKAIENLLNIRKEWDAREAAPLLTRIRDRLFPWAK